MKRVKAVWHFVRRMYNGFIDFLSRIRLTYPFGRFDRGVLETVFDPADQQLNPCMRKCLTSDMPFRHVTERLFQILYDFNIIMLQSVKGAH